MHRAPDYLLNLVDTELSQSARLGRVALMVTVAMATIAVGVLGGANPSLPSTARMAFAVIALLGALSSVFGLRTLSKRGALLARQRVVAAHIGVALAAIVALGAALIGYVKHIPAAYYVAGFGAFLLLGTIALLRQENRRFAALTARRQALARQLLEENA